MTRDRTVTSLLYVLAAAAVAHACEFNSGVWDDKAIVWIAWGLALTIAAVLLPRQALLERASAGLLPYALAGAIAFEVWDLLTIHPGMYLRLTGSPDPLDTWHGAIAAMAVLAGSCLAVEPWVGRWRVPLLLGSYVVAAWWIVKSSPAPFIDVHVFERDSVDALLRGENPYALTFPNIYGHNDFYGPGVVQNGRCMFGFPYPPVILISLLPGKLLFGDYRYSHAMAMTAAAALVYLTRPGRVSAGAAALLLLFPRGFLVVEQGWTEPYVVLTLALTVFAAARAPKLLPWALGLFLATKQYAFLAAPAALLLVRPFRLKDAFFLFLKAGLIGLAITVPFWLWNVKAFTWSVIELQVYQPFRDDALSLLVWWKKTHAGQQPPVALAFVGVVFGSLLSMWRLPRTPGGFAAAVAAIFFPFIAFNKQSFCNYYFFVFAALTIAVGTADLRLGKRG